MKYGHENINPCGIVVDNRVETTRKRIIKLKHIQTATLAHSFPNNMILLLPRNSHRLSISMIMLTISSTINNQQEVK
jgi:hypothetical protein